MQIKIFSIKLNMKDIDSFFFDFNSAYLIIFRVWLIFAGIVSVIFVPIWFDAVEQGYFYTFTSLIAAQVLFELGFGFVITQFAAHEMIGVKAGFAHHHSRVAHLLRFTNTWFNYSARTSGGACGLIRSNAKNLTWP